MSLRVVGNASPLTYRPHEVSVVEDPKPGHPGPRARPHPRSNAEETALDARTRELHLIQTLGRLAAETQTADELFRATISILQRAEELDLALVASALDGEREVICFVSRPFDDDVIERPNVFFAS